MKRTTDTIIIIGNGFDIAQVREYDYDEVNAEIEELTEIAKKFDYMETVRKMKEM